MASDDEETAEDSTADAATSQLIKSVRPQVYNDLLKPEATEHALPGQLGHLNGDFFKSFSPGVWNGGTVRRSSNGKYFEGREDKIVTPEPAIAVPTLESLRYTAHQQELRDMYIKLFCTSADVDTTGSAHLSSTIS